MAASKQIPLFAALLTLAAAFGPLPVLADREQAFAKQSQNPVVDVVSLPFENNILFGIGPSDSHAYLLNLKPVCPVRLRKLNQCVPPESIDTTNMEAFYRLQGACIHAYLEEAIEKHGSMQAYIRVGLALTDDEIKELRDQLLVSPSS